MIEEVLACLQKMAQDSSLGATASYFSDLKDETKPPMAFIILRGEALIDATVQFLQDNHEINIDEARDN